MTLAELPAVNATLNGLSTVLIATGWLMIRSERKRAHAACMISAVVTSSAFLACYLVYHANVGSVHFTDRSVARPIYFTLLISHLMLAFTVVPLVVATLVPAIRARWQRHRRIARLTLPVWLYVSVTGVIVYLMLYQWFPSAEIPSKLHPRATSAVPAGAMPRVVVQNAR